MASREERNWARESHREWLKQKKPKEYKKSLKKYGSGGLDESEPKMTKNEPSKATPKEEPKTINLATPKQDDRNFGEKALDIVSAPLSQPKTFFTKGPVAGGEAVAESRKKIREGDMNEGWKSIGITMASTAVVAGAVLGGAAIAGNIAAKTATATAIESGFAQQAAATASAYTPTATRTAINLIPKVGRLTINAKTTALTKSFLTKKFGWKAVAFAGTWMSSIFLGQWGQAEAPESIMIPIRDLIKTAETPEDWAEVDEYLKIAENISDKSTWEEIVLWSPFSAIEGISSKMKGVATGVEILADTATKARELQQREEEQGETDFARERRESDEAAIERKKVEEERQDKRWEDKQDEQDERDEKETAKYDKIAKDRKARDEEERIASEEESQRYEDIAAKNKADDLAEAKMEQEFSRLIGLKKYEEANALKVEFFEQG